MKKLVIFAILLCYYLLIMWIEIKIKKRYN